MSMYFLLPHWVPATCRSLAQTSIRKHFSHRFQHTKALVADNEFYTVEATAFELLEKADPAGLVLLRPLGSAENLTVTALIDGNRY